MTETNAPIAIKSSQIHASIIPPAGNDDNVPFSARELQLLYEEIFKDRKKKEDWRDDSRHPSYTNFTVPYHFKCRDRYHESKKEYEEQFQHEINQLMNNLNTAYEAARFNRHLCITSLWPPLHNRAELIHTHRYYFRLRSEQKRRLHQIFATNFQ